MSRPHKSVRWNNQAIHNITRGTKNREANLQKVLNQLNRAKVQDAKKRDLKRPHVPIMVDIPIPNFFVYYTKNHEIIRLELKDEQAFKKLYKINNTMHPSYYEQTEGNIIYMPDTEEFIGGHYQQFPPYYLFKDTDKMNHKIHHYDPFDTLKK